MKGLNFTCTFFIHALFCLWIFSTAAATYMRSSWAVLVAVVLVVVVVVVNVAYVTSCAWSSWAVVVTLSASSLFTPTTLFAALTPSWPCGPSWGEIRIQLKQAHKLSVVVSLQLSDKLTDWPRNPIRGIRSRESSKILLLTTWTIG